MRKGRKNDLRLPRNPLAHLSPEGREQALKLLNKHLRMPNTATVYETFSNFDPHEWTFEDFEAMRTGALARKGQQEGGKKRAEINETRDRRILVLFAAGKTPKEISEIEHLSYRRILQILHNK